MVTKPKVTVGTLCYNTGPFVVQALECVKRQNYVNIEHIVIDDASPDGSGDLVKQWIDENNYKCIFIKRSVNKGVHENLRDIFSLGTGKYLAMISDDLWTDTKLVEQVQLAEQLGDQYAIVYGDIAEIDHLGELLNQSVFEKNGIDKKKLPTGNAHVAVINDFFFYIQASLLRFDYLQKEINLNNDEVISEDWDWQLALSKKYKIFGSPTINAFYRIRAESITRQHWIPSKINRIFFSQIKMLLKYWGDPKYNHHILRKVLELYRYLNTEDVNFKNYRHSIFNAIARATDQKLYLLLKPATSSPTLRKITNRVILPLILKFSI